MKTGWDFLCELVQVIGTVLILIFCSPLGWIGLIVLCTFLSGV
jgi:hypothetical protein